jgi:hypothetical protein
MAPVRRSMGRSVGGGGRVLLPVGQDHGDIPGIDIVVAGAVPGSCAVPVREDDRDVLAVHAEVAVHIARIGARTPETTSDALSELAIVTEVTAPDMSTFAVEPVGITVGIASGRSVKVPPVVIG